jgi:hypothetical protein
MAPSFALAPSSLAPWLGAAGTTLAVIVALFKDSIREGRRKPRLSAICKAGKHYRVLLAGCCEINENPWTIET